jgi:membrane protein required for colicin V production
MEQQPFNIVDIVVAVLVLLSAVFAFYRGFVREVLAIAGWVGAFVATGLAYPYVRPYIAPYMPADWLATVATISGLFLVSVVVFWLIIHAIVLQVKDSPLNALDRSLGFLFGIARGVLVVALAFLLGQLLLWENEDEPRPEWVEGARALPIIEYSANLLAVALPEDILNLPASILDNLRAPKSSPDAGASEAEVKNLAQPPVAAPAADGATEDTGYTESEDRAVENLIESEALDEPSNAEGGESQQ